MRQVYSQLYTLSSIIFFAEVQSSILKQFYPKHGILVQDEAEFLRSTRPSQSGIRQKLLPRKLLFIRGGIDSQDSKTVDEAIVDTESGIESNSPGINTQIETNSYEPNSEAIIEDLRIDEFPVDEITPTEIDPNVNIEANEEFSTHSTTNLNLIGGADINASDSISLQWDSGISASHIPVFAPDAYRKAMLRTVLVLMSAVAFGLGTMVMKGKQSGLEFFAGYLVEQSLSVDNLFVFIMLFEYFKVPAPYQGRVLTWGIIGAVSMRAVMIVVGVAAIQRFRGVILGFAAILLVSSIKLLTEKEEEGDLSENLVLRISKFFVRSTDHYDKDKFFTKVDGKRMATPLLLCLVCIELSDFVFAVDSIPAVLGVSKDSFIVYTSNVFAIMALRSLYTLVSNAITDLPYLKPSVALVLGFVGLKMCLEFFHYEISIGISLSVVATLLFGGVMASVWENKRRANTQSNIESNALH